MKESLQYNQKGFTLIELLITIGVSSLIVINVFSFVMLGSRNYEKANVKTELQNNQQITTNFLSDSIMEGSRKRTELEILSSGFKLYTGKRILYYDGSSSLYIYDDGATDADRVAASNAIGSGDKAHLISDRISRMSVTINNSAANPNVKTVTVKTEFTVLGNTANTENTYAIRNR